MRELSIEEKAKAYDRALEIAEAWCKLDNNDLSNDDLKTLFPELKESEDDKVRKKLINLVKKSYEQGGYALHKWEADEMLAWLEKQGGQKSIWHNEDEEPKRGSLILLIMQSGTPIVAKIIEPNHTFNHGERWAYIDDLLEKQGEQKPVEWSEEDETRIKNILSVLDAQVYWEGATGKKGNPYQKDIDWLKSLRPQSHWKPTKQQLTELRCVISGCSFKTSILVELEENLKKLL